MSASEEARQEIARLVAQYDSLNEKDIRKYTEADTRRVFILPLFKALGWDVYSREEVTEEERASGGRVDYAFKLRGVSQFYLEAKALRADLNKVEYAKQVTTYAYNKGVIWAVLSDFEGLKVFNAQTGRPCLNLSYRDYLPDFNDLWLLSRESFEKNALNEWAQKHGVLPPRLGVEQRLYNQLRQWREALYTQLYHYNKHLTFDQIDEVIQRFFNRLIFIRTCEDRRIEERVLLSALHEWQNGGRKGEFVEVLRRIFRDFDGYYDSDLFTLHLTDQILVESMTLESIINGLYDVPGTMASYDFSVIDADVLGAVYEQYLGHVATVAKQRVQQEQTRMDLGFPSELTFEITAKKQRRKENGIYYTPRFVTDYIVKETVGRFLQEHSYNEALNIKILDPACGSGSFLIRAYDELLNYHADKRSKAVSELDQWERLPILTGNVFGVDLDMQAVEIARLNLLLRSLAKREVLPSLASNIRQGNSLISGTEEELRPYFGDAWREKKPFDWEQEFGSIMAGGGFDVIIGNPPYVNVANLKPEEREYFMDKFETALKRFDIYVGFIERGLKLLKPNGLLGFIVPYPFLNQNYAERLRLYILEHCTIERIVDLSRYRVFPDPLVRNVILILKREEGKKARASHKVQLLVPTHDPSLGQSDLQVATISQATFRRLPETMFRLWLENVDAIISKVDMLSMKLGTIVIASWGARGVPASSFHLDKPINEYCNQMVKGRDIDRYALHWSGKWFLYDPQKLYRPAFPELFENKKMLVSKVTGEKGLVATFDGEGYYTDDSLCCCILKYSLSHKEPSFLGKRKISMSDEEVELSRLYNLKYILGLVNSKLINLYFRKLLGYALNVYPESIEQLPVRRIDFNNPTEKKLHDDLVALVGRMLELNKRLAPIRTTPCNERDELLREIERTDREIDNLVYDLYGLSEAERKTVEEDQQRS